MDKVWASKVKSKFPNVKVYYEKTIFGEELVVDGIPHHDNINPKNKRELTERQHKSKGCVCGLHSICGHKEKWKYPKWKKKSRRNKTTD